MSMASVVFSAAPAGGYAYDDDERRNGVFTATVIDGLRCGAARNAPGFITVDTLHSHVSRSMLLTWLQEHKNRERKRPDSMTRREFETSCLFRSASITRLQRLRPRAVTSPTSRTSPTSPCTPLLGTNDRGRIAARRRRRRRRRPRRSGRLDHGVFHHPGRLDQQDIAVASAAFARIFQSAKRECAKR